MANDSLRHLRPSQRRTLKRFLQQELSREERLVLTLFYYEQMTFAEIGRTLDLTAARVREIYESVQARVRVAASHKQEKRS